MRFIVTGGCGYIGSHLVKRLYYEGHKVIVIENLSVEASNLRAPIISYWADIYIADLTDEECIKRLADDLYSTGIVVDGLFHLAALTSVPESILHREKYLSNNVASTATICKYFNCPILFSSSCAVYGKPEQRSCGNPLWGGFPSQPSAMSYMGIPENTNSNPQSPYASSKVLSEIVIEENAKSYIILRYFNPIGCEIENLKDVCETRISAALRSGEVTIYGVNYDTFDGTPIRDYIHISDLIDAHLLAFGRLLMQPSSVDKIYNVGTGIGISAYILCEKYKKLVNENLCIYPGKKREGDVSQIWANSMKFKKDFGWEPKKTIEDMVKDIM